MKILFILFLLTSQIFASFPSEISAQVLYLMHRGECEKAMKAYLDYSKQSGSDDFELLRQASLRLLESGIKKGDPETLLMCIFGAGISANPYLIPVLEKGLLSEELRIQVVALHYLSELQHDEADKLLEEALSSKFLLTRLEAAFELAKKNNHEVIEHLATLFYKMPIETRPLLAQIAAPIATEASSRFFEQLLSDPSREIRLAALQEAGRSAREDLLSRIRALAKVPDLAEQEAAIFALGNLMDEESKPFLREMASKKKENIRLIALKALHNMGEGDAVDAIFSQAKEQDPYAIVLLGSCSHDEKTIEELTCLIESTNPVVKFNAAFALLQCGKIPPHSLLRAMLLSGPQDFGFMKQHSAGQGLHHWVGTSGVKSLEKVYLTLAAETFEFRTEILKRLLELSEEEFLSVARMIFESNQYDLVSPVIELLCKTRSENAIALLKEMQQKTGAPLIRNYCNLALFRLNLEGPYEENLLKWVKDEKNHPIIRFKPEKGKKTFSRFELSPEETSQFLISAFETLASKQNQKGREALIAAIANGNEKNKYALCGLLMRMIE